MSRRSATFLAAVALERKKDKQSKQAAQRRRNQRLKHYDPTLTTTSHTLDCPTFTYGECTCA